MAKFTSKQKSDHDSNVAAAREKMKIGDYKGAITDAKLAVDRVVQAGRKDNYVELVYAQNAYRRAVRLYQ